MMDRTLAVPTSASTGLRPPVDMIRRWALLLSQSWAWIQTRKASRLEAKHLRVLETVSLGEKRFVAVVQFDRQQFLIGGGPASITLLTPLDGQSSFTDTLQKATTQRKRKQRTGESA